MSALRSDDPCGCASARLTRMITMNPRSWMGSAFPGELEDAGFPVLSVLAHRPGSADMVLIGPGDDQLAHVGVVIRCEIRRVEHLERQVGRIAADKSHPGLISRGTVVRHHQSVAI